MAVPTDVAKNCSFVHVLLIDKHRAVAQAAVTVSHYGVLCCILIEMSEVIWL